LNTNGFFFDGGWLAFGAGILVYYSINYLQPKRLWLPFLIFAIGILYAFRGEFGVGITVEQSLGQSFGFAALILFLSCFDIEMFQNRFLKPFLWCGAMCYSLYLVHLPITTLLSRWMYSRLLITNSWGVLCITLPVCLLASILVSRLFYHMIEKRFLNKPVV
jgi:peptidoglycan/LPS O-acetylase OafA/YrhL